MENSQKFQAKNFNIVVTPKVLENKLSGGFDITGYVNANESQQSGTVVSVGERCPKRCLKIFGIEISFLKVSAVKEGQVIVFKKHNATTMTIEGQSYLIVPYPDVILTL